MLKVIRYFTKKDWIRVCFIAVLVFGQVYLELKMPDYMSAITRLVQTEGSEMSEILENGGYMLACALGSMALAVLTGFFSSRLSANFSMNLRKALFTKVENLAWSDVQGFSTGSLITRTTNDITQIQMFVSMGFQMMLRAPIMAIWAITKIINKSWQWSTLTALFVVILLAIMITIMNVVRPKFKVVQKLTDRLNSVTRENLTGVRVVRAFNAEEYQEGKFTDINNELTENQLFTQNTMAIISPVMYLVMYMLTLGIYVIGAGLISSAAMMDKLTLFSDMIVFSSYAMQIIMSFLMLAMIFMILPRAQVSVQRINEVLDAPISIVDGTRTDVPESETTIEFDHVSFRYPDADADVLSDITFSAKKGETVAFIGSTGSGKSSIVNLVPRFYDVTGGSIRVNGVDVRDYTEETLHKIVGIVPQKAVMFNDTVYENVAYGDNGAEKTREDVMSAIETAQASEFISKMDDKEQSMIASGGTNISGGQKQRLAIARVIAHHPEIYIFDDSFSALDYKTDSALRHALREKAGDATMLIVAQRIGTILNADQIIVLEDGKCVGKGTHEELLKNNEVYRDIALSQLSEEELTNVGK